MRSLLRPSLFRPLYAQRQHFYASILTLRQCKRDFSSGEDNDNYSKIKSDIEELLKVPEHFNFAKDVVGKWAKKEPNSIALHFADGTQEKITTYDDLYQEAIRLATALSKSSPPPKLALVLLPKIFEWWAFNVAASWCGTVVSPATTLLTSNDVAQRLQECGADCIICDTVTADKLDTVTKDVPLRIIVSKEGKAKANWVTYDDLMKSVDIQDIKPCHPSRGNDTAQLFFTSGTTGKPKMVSHTQASYGIGHIATAKFWLDVSENDVVWNISDTGWAKAAWTSLYIPFISGATAFVHQMTSFDANEVLRSLSKYPVSVMCAPPTAYRAMVQCKLEDYKFHSLRRCVSAGEPLNPEVIERWGETTGLKIYEGYGQSETTLLLATGTGVDIRPGSMGKVAPGYDMKIIDDNWHELGPNEEGYIAISLKGGHPVGLFKGYAGDEKKTSEVFVGDYYLTGDRGYHDEDGYFWFVGRADDVIISSGYRIGPFEVESALLEHHAVAESAVVSSPDSLRGEVVKAFIVLAKDYRDKDQKLLIKDIQNHVKQTTAPYKYPRKVEFVESLPKNISGKIRRVVLRKKEWEKA